MANVQHSDGKVPDRHVKMQNGLPTPDTSPDSPNPRLKPCTYFQGSKDARDFIIDFNQDAASFAPDIQAYLECVGRCVRRAGYARAHHGKKGRYIPNMELVEVGRSHLQHAQQTGAPGIWLKPSDITADSMAQWPLFPWLPVLRAQGQATSDMIDELANKTQERWLDEPRVIPGNVRISLPGGLAGPEYNATWLNLVLFAYSNQHIAVAGLLSDFWYTDSEHGQHMRYALGSIGMSPIPEPDLPWNPDWSDLE